ncbi:MAG: 30S ribosomal protein S16 [Acidimicrobiales bacterium]|nr:30S ribosomal protein S16 [Acidimicrobiales bacterium]
MAVKLRLMRMGKKKQPTYRVVAADSRSPRDGRFIEILGTYEPRQDPSVISIDNDRAVHWLSHGAQPTERVEKLLKISGAWEQHTGETVVVPTPTAKVTVAADSKPAEEPVAAEAAVAEALAEDAPAEAAAEEASAAPAEEAEASAEEAADESTAS